jgi:hypothetical protein
VSALWCHAAFGCRSATRRLVRRTDRHRFAPVHHARCIAIPKNKGFCNFVTALEAVAAATRRSRDSTGAKANLRGRPRSSRATAWRAPVPGRASKIGFLKPWRMTRQSQSEARSREPEETFVRCPANPGGVLVDSAQIRHAVRGLFRPIRCASRCKEAEVGASAARATSAAEMAPIKKIVTKQGFETKAGSRLRVICATPVQKRSDSHRSGRFLHCVCRSLR